MAIDAVRIEHWLCKECGIIFQVEEKWKPSQANSCKDHPGAMPPNPQAIFENQ